MLQKQLRLPPRFVVSVQNGTTNSVSEIVDQLNKADLPDPSKVGMSGHVLCSNKLHNVSLLYQYLMLWFRSGSGACLFAHPSCPEKLATRHCSSCSELLGEGQWRIYR